MRDKSDRYKVESVPLTSSKMKRLGGYLVEAGLVTQAQIDVALNDQKMTGMKFGEILAARGWVKQQTIEYLMKKVVLPERQVAKRQLVDQQAQAHTATTAKQPQAEGRSNFKAQPREAPISKPLPSVGSNDGGVNWVG